MCFSGQLKETESALNCSGTAVQEVLYSAVLVFKLKCQSFIYRRLFNYQV